MRIIRFLILVSALVFFGLWIQAFSEKQDVEQALKAQYTQRISDTSEKMVHLKNAVDQSTMFEDEAARKPPLEEVWRLSSEIKNDIAMLPIHTAFRNEWSNYLTRLGNNAKLVTENKISTEQWSKVANQVVTNMSSFEQEWSVATLEQLNSSTSIKEARKTLDQPIEKNGFGKLYSHVKTYTESDFPLTASEKDVQKKKDLQALKDKEISEQEAIQKTVKIFPELKNAKMSVSKSKKDAPYPFYEVKFQKNNVTGYADLTLKGAHVVSMIKNRPIGKSEMSVEQLREMANKYLTALGVKDVKPSLELENTDVWHFSFVRAAGKFNAKVYADSIQLKLAKDNGELLGVNAMEYIQKETLPNQKVVPFDETTFFSKNVKIHSHEYAYSENSSLEQRLCHDFVITKENGQEISTYRVLVDTETLEIIQTDALN